jgi:hypothetical protein
MILSKFRRRRLLRKPERESPVFSWALDYPCANREPFVKSSGRVVQGWIVLKDEWSHQLEQVRVIAQWHADYELSHSLWVRRADVIEKVLGADPSDHPQIICGFSFTVPADLQHWRLLLEIEGQRWLLSDVSIDNADEQTALLKVLIGREGWLFLDNDTNNSVDQFLGRMRLTSVGLEKWRDYLVAGKTIAKKCDACWALLIAPAKESVLGELYHPLEAQSQSPIDQVLSLKCAQDLVYPVAALRSLGDQSYIPTDSHWTHKGASVAALQLAQHLRLDMLRCKAVLANDQYRSREIVGDLGDKLTPCLTSKVDMLSSFNFIKHKVYDNGLPNFGRLMVIEYAESISPGTCLLFGASSTYSMLNFLTRFFRRIVFVHSAGSIDPDLVGLVKPEFLVAQSNGRFVVKVPGHQVCLLEMIEEKVQQLSVAEREAVATRRVYMSQDRLDALHLSDYNSLLCKLLG